MRLPSYFVIVALLIPAPALAGPAELVTVAMETRSVDSPAYEDLGLLPLQRKLALRLTQAGFAVVAPHMRPRIRLVFTVEDGRIIITARQGEPRQVRRVQREQRDLNSYHLEVMHKAVGLTRQVADGLPSTPPPPTPPPPAPPPPAPEAPEQQGWRWELSLGASALHRLDGTDALVQAGVRYGAGQGVGLRGVLGVSPSNQDGLAVHEVSVQLGAAWRQGLIPDTLHLDAGLLVGFVAHRYRLEPAGEAGTRWDFVGSLTLGLTYQVLEHLGLRACFAPGLTEQSRRHARGGETLWSRSLLRIEAGAAVVILLD